MHLSPGNSAHRVRVLDGDIGAGPNDACPAAVRPIGRPVFRARPGGEVQPSPLHAPPHRRHHPRPQRAQQHPHERPVTVLDVHDLTAMGGTETE
ncbi:Uncharacterised protein [Mycobacteroides abscessus subsp. abscessus]|nr:Uncharacterised protein [Mycobacteroides abscessus subsp. abscessus]